MHENRETSGVPRPEKERGRSAKAQSQKADAHALEESDRAVVPVNQPNKGESSPAEVGEGRARTKENIVRTNTSPTQSGERVSQGLGGVREAANKRRQERFTALSSTLIFKGNQSNSCEVGSRLFDPPAFATDFTSTSTAFTKS